MLLFRLVFLSHSDKGILNFLQVFVPSPITEIGASYSIIQHVKRILGSVAGNDGELCSG